MAVIGYTPHPASGFVFHRDDGPSMHFSGAEADGLRQWVDASRGPDGRMAFDPSAPFGSASSVPDAQPAPPRTVVDTGAAGGMSMAPSAAPAMSSAPPLAPPAANPGAPMPTPSPAQEGAPPMARGPQQGPTITGPEAAAYALRKRYVPGRAAYDPEADAATRRAVPVAQTVTGGLAGTPEEEAQRLESAKALHAANQAAIAEVGAASAERAAAAEDARTLAVNRAIQADQEQKEALAKRAAVENTWNSTNARLQAESDAAAKQQVDPRRLFSGSGGTAAAIGSALAVGLGAFGASLNHGPNYAQQIIDASIQRDIDAQTDAIHRRGQNAQNAIANFQHTYGLTLDEARSAVKSTQLRYAAAMTDINAARIGSADARQSAAVMKAQLIQNAAMEEAKLAELYKGRVTKQFAMAAPQAGSRGGMRDPTDAEITAGANAVGAINKATGAADEGKASNRNADRMQQQFELERRVTLPDGKFAYATDKARADKAQARIDAGEQFKKNIARQREILSHTGDSLDPEMRGEYDSLVQQNILLSKDSEDLGAITKADQELVTPLTGVGGQDLISLKSKTLSAIKSAEQHVNFRSRQATKQLFEDANAQTPISKTEEGVGIRVTP